MNWYLTIGIIIGCLAPLGYCFFVDYKEQKKIKKEILGYPRIPRKFIRDPEPWSQDLYILLPKELKGYANLKEYRNLFQYTHENVYCSLEENYKGVNFTLGFCRTARARAQIEFMLVVFRKEDIARDNSEIFTGLHSIYLTFYIDTQEDINTVMDEVKAVIDEALMRRQVRKIMEGVSNDRPSH